MQLVDILLVDDDGNDCALFGIAADKRDLNIRLHTVTSGQQAIDYLAGRGGYADRSRHPVPGLVVLDLDMRLTGGLDFLDWRRASGAFFPVVIFSEFPFKGTIETALAMGASTFIAKPLELEGWEAVVRQIWALAMERSEQVTSAFAVGG